MAPSITQKGTRISNNLRKPYFIRVQAPGHCPRGHHVVHDPLGQRFRHFVQLHEFSDIVQHVVVLSRCRSHLLYDGGDVTENRGVQQRCKYN